jgi:hypothetical protein
LALLQVSTLPHKAAILHCNGHQWCPFIWRITPSYLLAIIWQTPQLNRLSNKCHTPQVFLPIHYSYTQKEIKLRGLANTRDTGFLIILLSYQNNKLNPFYLPYIKSFILILCLYSILLKLILLLILTSTEH